MEYLPVIAISVTIISAVWGHALWLGGQFKQVDEKFAKILSTITDKLEYHERHDDNRFSQITDGIWELRLQTALERGARIGTPKENKTRIRGEEDSV